MLSAPMSHITDTPLPGPMTDAAGSTTAQDTGQPLAPNAASVSTPTTGSAYASRHHPFFPLEEDTMDQGTDANPCPTAERVEVTRKTRKIHIAIIITKISYNNCKTLHTSNQPSKPHARTLKK